MIIHDWDCTNTGKIQTLNINTVNLTKYIVHEIHFSKYLYSHILVIKRFPLIQ